MKKIVIATDSYKECMEGNEVSENIKLGFLKEFPDTTYYTTGIADGGEGTVKSLVLATNGSIMEFDSVDALNRPIKSFIGFNKDKTTAFIEMAASSGIELIKKEDRNPLLTNSYGTGIMIEEALKNGVNHIIIGIGGSVTNDVGTGMLQALGVKFFDKNNIEITPNGGNLNLIASIDTSNMINLDDVSLEVACDVTNNLYGKSGATYTYGKQKGANDEQLKILENNVINFSKLLDSTFKVKSNEIIGGGAAGGLGVALAVVLKSNLKPGIEIVSNLLNLESEFKNADLVITGEGRIDGQSLNGKGPMGIAKLANKYNVPCIAICGSLGDDIELTYSHNITAAYSTMMQAESLQEAIKHTEQNLILTSRTIARTLKIGLSYKNNN